MLKITFKLSKEELVGIADLINGYLDCMSFPNTRGKWLRVTLYKLVHKLRTAETKRMLQGRPSQKVSLDVNEAFAFDLLFSKYSFRPTEYIDNSLMQMLNAIKQFYL